jgi:hypothetical protein
MEQQPCNFLGDLFFAPIRVTEPGASR